jgi:hypothetical protein
MNIIKYLQSRLTVQKAVELLELKTYDTALPQTWLDDLLLKMSLSPRGRTGQLPDGWRDIILSGLVWCYDGSLFGHPVALTKKVLELLDMECVQSIWDFKSQAAVIENRETFYIKGNQPVLEEIIAEDLDQAEEIFRAKYPGYSLHPYTSIDTVA